MIKELFKELFKLYWLAASTVGGFVITLVLIGWVWLAILNWYYGGFRIC